MGDNDLVGTVVNPGELWSCGSSYFPQIATHFATSGALLNEAGKLGDSAFNRSISGPRTEAGAKGPGPVPYFLDQLRDELHRVLGQSVDNLFTTGDALEKVAWAYVADDDEAARKLRTDAGDALDENANNPDETGTWTDDERKTDIKDKMKVPPADD